MLSERQLEDIDVLLIDHQGASLQKEWVKRNATTNHSSEFLDRGYKVFQLPDEILASVWSFFDDQNRIDFQLDDVAENCWPARINQEIADRLNRSHYFYAPPSQTAQAVLKSFLDSIAKTIESELASPWCIVNVRSSAALPSDDFGPTEWHSDGGPRFLRKILIYPNPMGLESGTIEIYGRVEGPVTVNSDGAVAILYDTSMLVHRGRPGRNTDLIRPMLEVTIAPSAETSTELQFSGQNARVPRIDLATVCERLVNFSTALKEKIDYSNIQREKKAAASAEQIIQENSKPKKRFKRFIKRSFRFKKLEAPQTPPPIPPEPKYLTCNFAEKINIGGGPNWSFDGWLNFDAVDYDRICSNIDLNENTTFPVSNRSTTLVYSSHCIEHLDDSTVDRVLSESRRVLRVGGALVLKIPDFDRVLERVAQRDDAFFAYQWGLEEVTPNWPIKGVEDTTAARGSFVFAGYWNADFGNPFEADARRLDGAYHGPAPLSETEHLSALALKDPRRITAHLLEAISKDEDFAGYNHQNSWTRAQLAELVTSHGFSVISQIDSTIVERFSDIPDIDHMYAISQYLWAVPS